MGGRWEVGKAEGRRKGRKLGGNGNDRKGKGEREGVWKVGR